MALASRMRGLQVYPFFFSNDARVRAVHLGWGFLGSTLKTLRCAQVDKAEQGIMVVDGAVPLVL